MLALQPLWCRSKDLKLMSNWFFASVSRWRTMRSIRFVTVHLRHLTALANHPTTGITVPIVSAIHIAKNVEQSMFRSRWCAIGMLSSRMHAFVPFVLGDKTKIHAAWHVYQVYPIWKKCMNRFITINLRDWTHDSRWLNLSARRSSVYNRLCYTLLLSRRGRDLGHNDFWDASTEYLLPETFHQNSKEAKRLWRTLVIWSSRIF